MPDITMCQGGKCPLKENCYRYRAVPDYLQSYFMEPPYYLAEVEGYDNEVHVKEICDYFDELQGTKDLKPKIK